MANRKVLTTVNGEISEVPVGDYIIENARYVATGTSTVTTTSGTFATLSGMTHTPTVAGTYELLFNCNASTGGSNGSGEWQVYKNGVAVLGTLRSLNCNISLLGGLVTVGANSVGASVTIAWDGITCNGTTDVIDVRWRSAIGGLTITADGRYFKLKRTA